MEWAPGYSLDELDAAQERFCLRFPPDLIALLLERRPVGGYDWTRDESRIRRMLAWPLEGLLFDVERDGLWWPEWGERPRTAEARRDVVAGVVGAAPKLIPIFSHRYLPEEPHEAGNPVFSVHQSDIICYGTNLSSYFLNEASPGRHRLPRETKRIRFWSDAVDRASDPAYYPFR